MLSQDLIMREIRHRRYINTCKLRHASIKLMVSYQHLEKRYSILKNQYHVASENKNPSELKKKYFFKEWTEIT